jgi:hypothetical protein
MMSLVIDADGHVEENLAELVGAIPKAMQPHAMRFVSVAGGHVTYEIEGRLWRSKYPYPGGLQNHVSAGGERREGGRDPRVRLQVLEDEGIEQAYLRAMSFEWRCRQAWHIAAAGGGTRMNPDAARNYGDFFNTHQFTGLFESMAQRELRRDPTILD